MKKVLAAILTALLFIAPLSAAPRAAGQSGSSAYRHAVHSYLRAAARELHAYHTEISAAAAKARGKAKERCAAALGKLHRCDALFSRLKKADHASFDAVKAEYEQARGKLIRDWRKVQHPSGN